jgi:hypothetical protein
MARNERTEGRRREFSRTGGSQPALVTVGQILDRLWRKACEAEGIDPVAKFVVFSPNNNYANLYNAMVLSIMRTAGRA